MTSMTPQQRCAAAITGQTVDRAPTYIPGIACEVASRILGRPVHTGSGSLRYAEARAWMRGEAAHEDFAAQLLVDLDELFTRLRIDVFRMPWRDGGSPAKQLDDRTFVYGDPDGDHTVMCYCPETDDFGPVAQVCVDPRPFAERFRASMDGWEAVPPKVELPAEHIMLCERFGGRYFVVCNGGGIGIGWEPDMMILLALEPELVRRTVALQARSALAFGQALAASSWPRVLVAGGDLAGNDGPFYSPAAFRQVMLPELRQAFHALREWGVHYIFRSDGNLWPVAGMLFGDAGCPGYGEVDRECGMTVAGVRARYPEVVTWGNMSVHLLQQATEAEVREMARRLLAESEGTRYFHAPSNAILTGTPVENVYAFFEENQAGGA